MPSNKFAQCVRQQVATALKQHYTDLGTWPSTQQLPIVYNEIYNVSFCGIENLHVFDSKKFRKVIAALEEKKLITKRQLVTSNEATVDTLLDVHTPEYLQEIKTSKMKVAEVTELPMLLMLPMWLLQWRVVKPMKYMVAGTMLAAALAIERGWSMNIGGGMHHAYSGGGAGWCIFSDLTLALRKIRKASQGSVNKIMIIDTDVHQGNGYEKDKLTFEDNQLYILDIYNSELWPHDTSAKTAIDNMVELRCGTKDGQYLTSLESALQQASRDFQLNTLHGKSNSVVASQGTSRASSPGPDREPSMPVKSDLACHSQEADASAAEVSSINTQHHTAEALADNQHADSHERGESDWLPEQHI